jgi:hypothetical protein
MSTGKTLAVIGIGCSVLGVALIAVCGGLLYSGYQTATSSVGPEIDRLFTAMANGTFPETYTTATTSEFRSATSKEQYAEIGNAVSTRLGKLKTKSLKSFNMQQQNASSYVDVTYDASFEKGAGQIIAKLTQEDGEWRLVNFRVNSPVFQQDIATAKCPKCGAPHASGARFCPACGAPLTDDAGAKPEKPAD